ncbi:MAG: carbohydrate binding domain-containing protein [Polyangiaceae bacterium]
MTYSTSSWLAVSAGFGVAACANSMPPSSAAEPHTTLEKPVIVIQAYAQGISGVHAANPDVKVRIERDPAQTDEAVLLVEYPKPTENPAGRDVWCDAEVRDWSTGSAISFQIKPAGPEKLSVSFFDRNRVVYTTWSVLEGGVWQPVRVEFAQLRPNPYFQPPDAKTGAPIDVSDIRGFAFAPHSQASGRLLVTKFVLAK